MIQPQTGFKFITTALAVLGLVVTAFAQRAQADAFNITYEQPGVENANATALCTALGTGTCVVGTEPFTYTASKTTFTSDFGTGGTITGTYINPQVNKADQYGGAGGTGNYVVAFGTTPYQVNLRTTLATGLNYFGFWLSALDQGNTVSFYKSGVDVFDFTPAQVIAGLGVCGNGNPYCGNPNAGYKGLDSNEQFVFVNFFDTSGSFDSIHFLENPSGGGYESDNHTVGYVTAQTGIQAPEPSGIAVFAIGLIALAGLRRLIRRRLAMSLNSPGTPTSK